MCIYVMLTAGLSLLPAVYSGVNALALSVLPGLDVNLSLFLCRCARLSLLHGVNTSATPVSRPSMQTLLSRD